MSEKTIIALIDEVQGAAVAAGMDVSPKDVAFIISLFFEGMADSAPVTPQDAWLQSIADECNRVT